MKFKPKGGKVPRSMAVARARAMETGSRNLMSHVVGCGSGDEDLQRRNRGNDIAAAGRRVTSVTKNPLRSRERSFGFRLFTLAKPRCCRVSLSVQASQLGRSLRDSGAGHFSETSQGGIVGFEHEGH